VDMRVLVTASAAESGMLFVPFPVVGGQREPVLIYVCVCVYIKLAALSVFTETVWLHNVVVGNLSPEY
jgi:hypothetical protein